MGRVVRMAAMMCAMLMAGAVARGQGTEGVVKMEVAGAAIGRPALEWVLLPQPQDVQEGNAALAYQMAINSYLASRPVGDEMQKEDEKIDKLLAGPLGEMDMAAAKGIVEGERIELMGMRDGARREHCDWQLPLKEEGVYTLLPYLGPMRQITRRLAVAIRMDIRNHDWAGAHDKLQTGYSAAHQMGSGRTIIEGLVGTVMAEMMNNCVRDWIGERGSPNLFWPLAGMPHPVSSLSTGIRNERSFVYIDLPEWKTLESGKGTPALLAGAMGHFMHMASGSFGKGPPRARGVFEDPLLAATGMAIIEYPQAKAYLEARGVARAEVEKRDVAAVVGEFETRSYEEIADEMFKWTLLPPEEALPGLQGAMGILKELPATSFANVLARTFLPSLNRAMIGASRPERQLAVMRIVEGVRDYVGREGKLPESVEALGLPVAVDPLTGKGFGFTKEGEEVVITGEAPAAGGVGEALRWEVTFKK